MCDPIHIPLPTLATLADEPLELFVSCWGTTTPMWVSISDDENVSFSTHKVDTYFEWKHTHSLQFAVLIRSRMCPSYSFGTQTSALCRHNFVLVFFFSSEFFFDSNIFAVICSRAPSDDGTLRIYRIKKVLYILFLFFLRRKEEIFYTQNLISAPVPRSIVLHRTFFILMGEWCVQCAFWRSHIASSSRPVGILDI